MAVITISREPGALGEEIAARVAGKLGFLLVDKTRLFEMWREAGLDEERFNSLDEHFPALNAEMDSETEASFKLLDDFIIQLAEEHDLVVIGRGAQALFKNCPGTLHVRVIGSRQFRVDQVRKNEGLSSRGARRLIRDLEIQRARYVRFFYRANWADSGLYDLTLRLDRLTMEQAANLIAFSADQMQIRQAPRNLIVAGIVSELPEERGNGPFANPSEAEFARFLEFYAIPFLYEPRTFTLESDAAGNVLEAFTPDFYLPDQNLYIELTTMKQSLVTRKNRKVRKLRKLYPEVNIRLFYQRDFFQLMAKYGLMAPSVDKAAG